MLRLIAFFLLLFLIVVLLFILQVVAIEPDDEKEENPTIPKQIPEDLIWKVSSGFGAAYAATQNNYRMLTVKNLKTTPMYSGIHFSTGFSNDFL